MLEGISRSSLTLCYTFHPNQSMGIVHDLSGYWILVRHRPFKIEGERNSTSSRNTAEDDDEIVKNHQWDLLLHRDLGWASMRYGSAFRLRIRAGISYEMHLFAREMSHVHTKAYPCNTDLKYNQDKASRQVFYSSFCANSKSYFPYISAH